MCHNVSNNVEIIQEHRGVIHVNGKPCCAAEALRRIRPVDVGGMVIGIAMLDPILTVVKGMKISGEKEIGDELLERVKIYNYVPASAEAKYQAALLREYRNLQEWRV